MKVTWLCKHCGKIVSTEATYNNKTEEYHATFPENYDEKCTHHWYPPIEIRRGI